MNTVMIIPTGIGAEIGGHAGDGNAVARLLGAASETLILHPNVVNASDINEMPENSLYVEGSMLDRFLAGEIELEEVWANRILLVMNPPLRPSLVNSASAAKVTLGLDIRVMALETPLEMIATMKNGCATGIVKGWRELVEQVRPHDFDALAIASEIKVDREAALHYLRHGGVNLWGGVEAKASRLIANALQRPVAHAPIDTGTFDGFNEVVDPRMSAETVSVNYVHCILKGLHRAPRIGEGFSVNDIDVLISPDNCFGLPHILCDKRDIPVIVVKENKTVANCPMPEHFIFVESYLEAAGALLAWSKGISLSSTRRPVDPAKVACLDENYLTRWDCKLRRGEPAHTYSTNQEGR